MHFMKKLENKRRYRQKTNFNALLLHLDINNLDVIGIYQALYIVWRINLLSKNMIFDHMLGDKENFNKLQNM